MQPQNCSVAKLLMTLVQLKISVLALAVACSEELVNLTIKMTIVKRHHRELLMTVSNVHPLYGLAILLAGFVSVLLECVNNSR